MNDEFTKADDGKLRYGLIPPEFLKGIAEVLTMGSLKYSDNNWKNVDDESRYVDALYRHLEAWRSGEINDPESGLPHLAHVATNVAFLTHFDYAPDEWSKEKPGQVQVVPNGVSMQDFMNNNF